MQLGREEPSPALEVSPSDVPELGWQSLAGAWSLDPGAAAAQSRHLIAQSRHLAAHPIASTSDSGLGYQLPHHLGFGVVSAFPTSGKDSQAQGGASPSSG